MSAVFILLLAYLGGIAYSFFSESEGTQQDNARAKNPQKYFDTKNYAFLGPTSLRKGINPLSFSMKIVLPPPPKPKEPPKTNGNQPPKQNTTTKTTTTPAKTDDGKKPATEPTKKQETAKPTEPPKTKPTPPKPIRKIDVTYRGFIKGNANQVAFYSAVDSQSKKTEAKAAHEGAVIHGLLKIKNFDGEQLTISVGDKEVSVKKGKKQVFEIQ